MLAPSNLLFMVALASLTATKALAHDGGPIKLPLHQVVRDTNGGQSTPLFNVPGLAYSASGTIRNQTFQFLIDTGSSDVVVNGPNCPQSQCTEGTRYDDGGQNLNQNLTFPYGSGTVRGELFTDTMTIDGKTATNQTLLSASSNLVSNGTNITALVGMGFPIGSKSNSTPFFQNLVNQGVVTTPEFGVYLALAEDGGPNQGELTLGGRNDALYTGEVTTVPISTELGHWNLTIDDVQVAGKSVGSAAAGKTGFIDTGGPILNGPPEAMAAIFAAIPGALELELPKPIAATGSVVYAIPCNTSQENMPALVMSGRPFAVSVVDLIGVPATGVQQPGYCFANAVGLNFGSVTGTSNGWQLGDVFLRNWYTVFNLKGSNGTPCVEFAQAKRNVTQPVQKSPAELMQLASLPVKGPASASGNSSAAASGTAQPSTSSAAPPSSSTPAANAGAAQLRWSVSMMVVISVAVVFVLI